nr:reverse transcriptase domain-containing protein [Tanacetum cinerariifolium]
ACPHHGFSELHQLDTFYNALNVNDQDSLNSATGGNFLDKIPSDCLKIVESKSKVRQSRAKAVVSKVNSSSSTPAISSDVAELKDMDMVRALLLDKKNQSSAPASSHTPASVKAVESNCVTYGGTHSYQNYPATSGNVYQDNIQKYVSQAAAANYNQGNTGFRPQMVANQIRPLGFPPVQNNQNNFNRGNNFTQNRGGNFNQSNFNQSQLHRPQVNQAPIPQTQSVSQTDFERYYQTVQNQLTNLTDMMSKFMSSNMASSSGSGTLPGTEVTKDQVKTPSSQSTAHVQPSVTQSKTPVSEPIVAPVSASMPNLKPSIPYPSSRDNERRQLALPETPTCMNLELADCSVSKLIGIAKDVSVKTGRALIDVHKGELTLRIGNEAITYNFDQTSRYSANYDQMTANKIDLSDEACEEYFQEVLGFSDVTASGSPTPSDDPIVSTTSPMLTPFGDSDFLLFEEANAFLGLEDDPDSPELDPSYYDPEGDIQMLEAILNSDPAPSLPNHEQSVPSFTNELKACEAKTIKSSVDKPPEVELKDLPPHLEYAFLEGDNKFPVIIAKELGDKEKAALIKVLKSHKRAIAWKPSDIQGINPEFCTHKILMEEDYKPAVQHQ